MKLIIIDDHPLVRKGLLSMLSDERNINEVIEAQNISEALKAIERKKPDIAVVDLKLGGEDGLEAVVKGKRISPNTKFIILSAYVSKEEFMKAEKIGLDGYILKDAFTEDIIYAINLVARGKKYYDSGIIKYKDYGVNDNLLNQLTDREKDVLRELANGYSNEEIAKRLFISENTVKKHVSSILFKLNLNHRTQAAVLVNNSLSFNIL